MLTLKGLFVRRMAKSLSWVCSDLTPDRKQFTLGGDDLMEIANMATLQKLELQFGAIQYPFLSLRSSLESRGFIPSNLPVMHSAAT